jgi:nitrate/nitrite-specific signal transduction histidine kinase
VGLPEDIDRHQGMGLNIMKYRAESIGASISIQPRPEGGTAVVSRLKHACRRKRSHV